MLHSRPKRALMRGVAAFSLALAAAGTPSAFAQGAPPSSVTGSPPAADAMTSARQSWDAGQYDAAENLYKAALDRGGLAPDDVVDGYVRLGAARAIQKKTALARAAFRQAALIDSHFKVPPEAGKRAAQIALLGKRDEARIGSIRLNATIPSRVPANAPFSIHATLDGKHTVVVARIGMDVVDSGNANSPKHFTTAEVVATKIKFEVPASVTTPGALLVVRIDALDPHDNRLASREQRVQVDGTPPPPPAAAPPPPVVPTTATTTAPQATTPVAPPATATRAAFSPTSPVPPDRDRGAHTGGGFWSSPWPYLVGGALLAGAGAATYFYLRPTEDVSVGAARVNTR